MSSKNNQLKIEPVRSSLIKQNCFARVARPYPIDLKQGQPDKMYFELQRTPTKKGIGLEENLTAVEYPITADYVGSHLGETNYKIDPLAAVARAGKRDNLGDIRNVMDIMSMDTEEAVAAFRNSLEHVKKVNDHFKTLNDKKKEEESK